MTFYEFNTTTNDNIKYFTQELILPINETIINSKTSNNDDLTIPDFYVTIRSIIGKKLPELLVNIGSSYNAELAKRLNRKLQGY